MDRITVNELSKSATSKWIETIPKIVRVAGIENDPTMNVFLEDIDNSTDGKFLATL